MHFPGGIELVVIVVLIVVLFGAKRLPELGRSLGEGIKEFKKSTKGIMEDDGADEKDKKESKP